jgi:hypothetical protein
MEQMLADMQNQQDEDEKADEIRRKQLEEEEDKAELQNQQK